MANIIEMIFKCDRLKLHEFNTLKKMKALVCLDNNDFYLFTHWQYTLPYLHFGEEVLFQSNKGLYLHATHPNTRARVGPLNDGTYEHFPTPLP